MTETPANPAAPPAATPAPDPAAKSAPAPVSDQAAKPAAPKLPKEIGGPTGPEPTRFGDWERKGRVSDF